MTSTSEMGVSQNDLEARTRAQVAKFTGRLSDQKDFEHATIRNSMAAASARRGMNILSEARAAEADRAGMPIRTNFKI
jgi:hypothetical protein